MDRLRTAAIWIILLGIVVSFSIMLSGERLPSGSSAQLASELARGTVLSMEYGDEGLVVERTDGARYEVPGAIDPAVWDLASAQGVPVGEGEDSSVWGLIVGAGAVALVLLAFVAWRKRQATQVGNIFQMRRSTARLVKPGVETLRFADVGGLEEAKESLADVVDFLKSPERWVKAGVRLPRGVLLEGPPGCGKTLLARAVAGEAGVPVYVVSASEFVEMFVGVGAARIRDLFETAAKTTPCVVFIDELDALGRRRGSGIGASHDEREQTLNQLLVNLDGFERMPRMVVIAATNRADVLDAALLRPGRFDLRIAVPPLDRAARVAVLRIHLRKKLVDTDVSVDALADRTTGQTGADLEVLCNNAAMAAVRRTRDGGEARITAADFEALFARHTKAEHAFDRVDQLLLESASQLARPQGTTRVHVRLVDGLTLDGSLLWADANFLKIEEDDGSTHIFPKLRVQVIRASAGTATVPLDEQVGDLHAGRRAETA